MQCSPIRGVLSTGHKKNTHLKKKNFKIKETSKKNLKQLNQQQTNNNNNTTNNNWKKKTNYILKKVMNQLN